MASTNGNESPSILSIYEPVKDDLVRAEEHLRQVCQVGDFPLLSQLLDHALKNAGKQVRPALTLLCSKFHPYEHNLPVVMATAIELLHIATLIHDDTVDNSSLRRGKPTISSLFGKDTAVLIGDYVFAKSATVVCDTGNVKVIRRFAETIMALSSGELRERVTAFDWRQTRENYYNRIDDKTASLFSVATESGAILSGVPENVSDAFRAYGHNLGMAFQVIDDILDFQGSEDVVGKPVGSDLLQGVLTLPAIMLAERYPKENPIKMVFEDKDNQPQLKKTVGMIRDSGIIDEAFGVARGFCEKARDSIKDLPQSPARTSLVDLTEYVLERKK